MDGKAGLVPRAYGCFASMVSCVQLWVFSGLYFVERVKPKRMVWCVGRFDVASWLLAPATVGRRCSFQQGIAAAVSYLCFFLGGFYRQRATARRCSLCFCRRDRVSNMYSDTDACVGCIRRYFLVPCRAGRTPPPPRAWCFMTFRSRAELVSGGDCHGTHASS